MVCLVLPMGVCCSTPQMCVPTLTQPEDHVVLGSQVSRPFWWKCGGANYIFCLVLYTAFGMKIKVQNFGG